MNCTCVVDWLRITKRRHIQLIKSAEWKNNSFFMKNIIEKLKVEKEKNSPFS